mmetsp:Transcript_1593/g.4400  ORF Transcript_1593/g.4400 Transcript_1593/m.4400 type:complete len:93 (+) Transcript_1593:389-667(+)
MYNKTAMPSTSASDELPADLDIFHSEYDQLIRVLRGCREIFKVVTVPVSRRTDMSLVSCSSHSGRVALTRSFLPPFPFREASTPFGLGQSSS